MMSDGPLIPTDPLYPRMLRSRRPPDIFEAIITPGWRRLQAEDWLKANDPGEAP